MQAVIGMMVFSGAFAVAVVVMAATVAPQWRRILRLASGKPETTFTPLSTLVHAERRIAVNRWASAPIPAPIRRLRAAA